MIEDSIYNKVKLKSSVLELSIITSKLFQTPAQPDQLTSYTLVNSSYKLFVLNDQSTMHTHVAMRVLIGIST